MHPVLATIVVAPLVFLTACGGSDKTSSHRGPPRTPPPEVSPAPTPDPTPTPEAPGRPLTEAEISGRLARQPAFAAIGADTVWRTHGATGHGVRIAIWDTPVDILHPEVTGRVGTEGSQFTYRFLRARDLRDLEASPLDAEAWGRQWERRSCGSLKPAGTNCREFRVSSLQEGERQVRAAIESGGYPGANEFWLVRIRGAGVESIRYVPSPRLGPPGRKHGTQVASTAAGATLGVAPGAVIAPRAVTLGADSGYDAGAREVIKWAIEEILAGRLDGTDADRQAAEQVNTIYDSADITNHSYGPTISGEIDNLLQWERARWEWQRSRVYLPKVYAALVQRNRRAQDQVLLVTAAGNERQGRPAAGAADAYFEPDLRGLSFAVAALGDDHETIATYSNRCGGLPRDWVPRRDGRHYCLSAPGTVLAQDVHGNRSGVRGTSFAAPIVSGGLALMKERFRGQMTPRELGLRMVNTADNAGRYANAGIYGAGVLDLGEAMSPQGMLMTGRGEASASLGDTWLYTPAAWGDVGRRLGRAEIAAFDTWDNAPFWSPLRARVGARVDPGRGVFPAFATEAPSAGATWGALAWRAAGDEGLLSPWHLALSADPGGELHAAGLAYRPRAFAGALRAGLVFERDGMLGGRGAGAFTSAGASHGLAFGTFARTFALGEGAPDGASALRLAIASTWAGGRLTDGSGILVEASGLYSQHSIALEHERGGVLSRLSVEQPLRAELGSAAFHRPIGRDRVTGDWQYDTHRVGLRPDARALTLGLHHERDLGAGRIALGGSHTVDAGHVAGREENTIGARYRLRF